MMRRREEAAHTVMVSILPGRIVSLFALSYRRADPETGQAHDGPAAIPRTGVVRSLRIRSGLRRMDRKVRRHHPEVVTYGLAIGPDDIRRARITKRRFRKIAGYLSVENLCHPAIYEPLTVPWLQAQQADPDIFAALADAFPNDQPAALVQAARLLPAGT